MKRSTLILIDGLIAVAIIAGVYFYFKNQSSLNENPKPTVRLACGPAESYDCTLKDFKIASGTLALTWQKLPLKIEKLPTDSWYKVTKETDKEYELNLYPNVGKHYILGNHDFSTIVKISKPDRSKIKSNCIKSSAAETLSLKNLFFQTGEYDISIDNGLNYYYNGGAGSNPNPYTGDVLNILQEIKISIGKCN